MKILWDGICYNLHMDISWRFWTIIGFILLYHPVEAVSQEAVERIFKPSQMISFELSKKELKKIYWEDGQNRTLHCGCVFDKIQQLAEQVCSEGMRGKNPLRTRKILGWVHAVPVTIFAKPLKCWNEALCRQGRKQGGNGARCCNVLSQKFKKREADMHNLFPAVASGDEEEMEPPPLFGGMEEYRYCREPGKPVLNPRPAVRGDIARAYFYMSRQYKFAVPNDLEDRLRLWHLKDPPDTWEEERNSLIETVQGNRNPFIDHPELVERVCDF